MQQQEQQKENKPHFTINGVTATMGDLYALKKHIMQKKNAIKYIGILDNEQDKIKYVDIVTEC